MSAGVLSTIKAAVARRGSEVAASLLAASLLALAAPPWDLWPFAFAGLATLYLTIRERSIARAAGIAWSVGTLTMAMCSPWWVPLLRRFADVPWLAAVPATVLLSAYQAIPFALWGGACRWLHRRFALSWLFVAPLCIILAETAVPFLFKFYLAVTVWRVWPLVQIAELGGPPAVSGMLVLGSLALAETFSSLRRSRRPRRAVGYGAILFLLLLCAGGLRGLQVERARTLAPRLRVGVVQPNFGLVSRRERDRHGHRYLETLRRATLELYERGARLIVWPETAWPFLLDRRMRREFPPDHPWELRPGVLGRLLLGTLTHRFGGTEVYNSVVLIDEAGAIAGRYDKNRLVAFAESIPFAEAFPARAQRLRDRFPDWPRITPGEEVGLLIDGELRIATLICSEDVDFELARKVFRLRPNLIVALASDAWFGHSAAPKQHLALSLFRAVEARRDMVRATNHGVSAILDATGRIRRENGLAEAMPGSEPTADLLIGDVALLEIAAHGASLSCLFPAACLGALVAAVFVVERRRWILRRGGTPRASGSPRSQRRI